MTDQNYQFSLTYPNTSIFCIFFTLNFLHHIDYIEIKLSKFKNLIVKIKFLNFLIILVGYVGSTISNFGNATSDLEPANQGT